MMKRILSLLLAVLLVTGIMPVPTYAEDAPEGAVVPTEETTGPSTEAVTEPPCNTCGLYDCISDHLTWCAACRKDDCGVDHTAIVDAQPCEKCGSAACAGHENWCDLCKKDNCGQTHFFCDICQKNDCGMDHTVAEPQPCDKCGSIECAGHENWCDLCKKDNCGLTHVFCETCQKNDCGVDHTATEPQPCDKCGSTECPGHENWCDLCKKDNCGLTHVFCEICQKNDCGIAHEEEIEIPACSGAPTCWGGQNQQPLPNHADGCGRKDYLKKYVSENTAETIVEDWPGFTEAEKEDVISMAEAYSTYGDALKQLVQWETEPEEPECDCGITGDAQYHAIDCPVYLHWVDTYVVKLSAEEISSQWSTLDKNTRESILAILAENAPDKLERLKPLLPDITITKDAVVAGAEMAVAGDIPADVSLEASSVTADHYNSAIFDYVPNSDAVLFAIDITLLNPDGSKWQPYEGEAVTVELEAAALNLSDGERVRLLHDHEGIVEDMGTYTISDGILTFRMDKFSGIYAIPVTTVEANAVDGVIYFDLNAGNVIINGNSYSGFRFDGTDTAKEVTGTLEAGQSYYVYQSNDTNKAATGLFKAETEDNPVYEMRLPNYARVTYNELSWGEYITNNNSTADVIAAWTNAEKDGRTATGNYIQIRGQVNCSVSIDNLWSNHEGGNRSSQRGGLNFDMVKNKIEGSDLTVKMIGDNRMSGIFSGRYGERDSTTTNCMRFVSGGELATLTVANSINVTAATGANRWASAIGGNDGTEHFGESVCECTPNLYFSSGIIFAGTTVGEDTCAIGGGGNGTGTVIIDGATVTAVAYSTGATIGGGIGKSAQGGIGYVTITDGTVYAYNFSNYYSNAVIPGAAIGGGSSYKSVGSLGSVNISGGTVYAQSVGGVAIGGGSSTLNGGGNAVITISQNAKVTAISIDGISGMTTESAKAGTSIGGGNAGTSGDGGNCELTIEGNPTIYTGSIGGGGKNNAVGNIGSAVVEISGGTTQGQIIMAKGATTDCSFTMTGGVIDNTSVISTGRKDDSRVKFDKEGKTYTFLQENGGAVYVENGIATLSGGTVQKTKATNGGAFYVTGGTFNMTGGKINASSATETGGAICVVNGTADISNGTIRDVTAPDGGAVAVNGGEFDMTGGTISSFKADVNGGAVYVMGGTAKVGGTITGSNDTEARKGGAVYVGGGTFEMTGGSMTNCDAGTMGGAVCVEKVGETSGTATITSGQISNVHAPNGGAVAVSGGSFTMSGGSISGVKATSDGIEIDGLGGAVYVNDGTATVSGGTITGYETEAEAGSGGGVYVKGGSFIMSGGTMANFNVTGNGGMVCVTGEGAAATIQGGTISGNPAANVNEAANGGAVYVAEGGSFTIDGNGNIENCNATEDGGGVYLASGTFTSNGGSFTSCSADGDGGGLYLGGGKFTMPGGSFITCKAGQNGGAVCIMGGDATITGGTIQGDNTVSGDTITPNTLEAEKGGGIYVGGGELNMANGTITKCSATNGGAAYITGGVCNMKGGQVSYNHAVDGGAMYVVDTPVTYGGLNDLTVEWNIATNNGGGMYIHNENKNTSITNGVIRNNTAGNFGGGLYHTGENGSCTVSGAGQIRGNTAKNGGGLYIIGGSTLNVNGGHITENRAVGEPADTVTTAYNHVNNVGVGGGVYVGPGTTIRSSFTMAAGKAAGIYANTADFAADDLYANIGSTVLSLPNVDGMSLGDSMTATGWYCDYAAGDEEYNNSTLLSIDQFQNPDAVTANSIERYRYAAEFSETAPYLVDESLGNVSGKYICLTIGSNIINFGQIVISKSGSKSDDQYFVFRIEATSLENKALERPVFEVTIRGNSSVTIDHVPFGQYTISEVESWSWRYEVSEGNQKEVTVNAPDEPLKVSFGNQIDTDVAYDAQYGSLWLDGNSDNAVNAWRTPNTSGNVRGFLSSLFGRKGDEA